MEETSGVWMESWNSLVSTREPGASRSSSSGSSRRASGRQSSGGMLTPTRRSMTAKQLIYAGASWSDMKKRSYYRRSKVHGPLRSRINMRKQYLQGSNVWKGNCHVGALTERGFDQLYLLGKALHGSYAQSLGLGGDAALEPDHLFVRSTDIPRTIISAQGLLLGFTEEAARRRIKHLYSSVAGGGVSAAASAAAVGEGTNGGTIGGSDSTNSPRPSAAATHRSMYVRPASELLSDVTLHTMDFATETMIPNPILCPQLHRNLEAAMKAPHWMEHSISHSQPLLANITAALGEGKRFNRHLRNLYDCMGSHICMGNEVPSALAAQFDALDREAAWTERAYLSYPSVREAAQLGLGAFLQELGAHLVKRIIPVPGDGHHDALAQISNAISPAQSRVSGPAAEAQRPRLSLFSGHDTSIMGVLVALGIFDDIWPPYASHIEFELLRSKVPVSLIDMAKYESTSPDYTARYSGIARMSVIGNEAVEERDEMRNRALHTAEAEAQFVHALLERIFTHHPKVHPQQREQIKRVLQELSRAGELSIVANELRQYHVRVVYNGNVKNLPFCEPSWSATGSAAATDDAAASDARFMNGDPSASAVCPLLVVLDVVDQLSPVREDLDGYMADTKCGLPSFGNFGP